MNRLIKKIFTSILALVFVVMPLYGCSEEPEVIIPADYGSYGADFAREFASSYPYRKPYSEQENQAGQMIYNELSELGYEVEVQTFNGTYGGVSNNYIVRISGSGFIGVNENDDNSDYETYDLRKTVVIGAHYDSSFSAAEVPEGYTYDGISDNASGVGCLMTIAKEISSYQNNGFDVIIVFFGAGNDTYAGANYFYASLTSEERESIEVMYCIDSIYAGDKIYASAGYNSLDLSQKYTMRRKLYQAYDVCYDSELYSNYAFTLLYNESNIVTDVNGDGVDDVFREVSNHKSDYVVFDYANIPVVYFDSGDYFFDTIDEMKETKNLNLQEFGGIIRGTLLDSSTLLDPILVDETEDRDLLEIRINCVAYIILESMLKGSDYGMTEVQFNDYLDERRRQEEEALYENEEDSSTEAIQN